LPLPSKSGTILEVSEIASINEKERRYSREIKEKKQKLSGIDEPFTVLVLLLLLIGLVCLYSASYVTAYSDGESSTAYVVRQGIFAAAGVVAMFTVAFGLKDYRKLHYLAWPLMIFSILLLATIFIPGLWATINKATRWIKIPGIGTFQPSEISKFAFILCFSSWSTIMGTKKMKNPIIGFGPFIICMGFTALLLMKQPHLSATVTIAAIGAVIIYLGGASTWCFIGAGGGAIAFVLWYLKTHTYAMTRINVWLDPFIDFRGSGWQGAQSLITIASGGVWGLGLGQGRQKHLYLPEPANDFIFSVICEELGFIGAFIIIILFAALVLRGYYIASKAPDRFGTLLVAGITTQIAVQTIFNLGVVSGLLPVTGASLPFFSYGGTSLMMLLGEMGIILAVSRRRNPEEKENKDK